MAGISLRGNVTYDVNIWWDGVSPTDETSRVKRITIRRGKSDDLGTMQAGECNLVLADTTGRFNPTNTASPLYPYIARPMRSVVVAATYLGTRYVLFGGRTRAHQSDPGRDAREARIDCVDRFMLLDLARPTVAPAVMTTGNAINAILLATPHPGPGLIPGVDAWGDSITFEADGSASGLQLIGDLLQAERGWFFYDRAGFPYYLYRHWQARSPYNVSQGTIASTMRAIAPGVEVDRIRNRATVTAAGGTAQVAEDWDSIDEYGQRDFAPITSPYLNTDAQAASLGSYMVSRAGQPLPPVRSLTLDNGNPSAFAQLLARELADHVTVTESIGGTSGSYHIQAITHEIDWSAGLHRGTWTLVKRDAQQPFLIGSSTIGGPDVITY